MSLLLLKEIGKIYASEAAIAVGIRGVNLSFDKGEFVAVTGKSGSGKSTLLNVISGMDTYEEGEMFIEGEPTSHYQQEDWEEYRHKYISFVFQDYNIIDSFTVLENVELALMYIEDAKERRKKAVELLTRVGMEKFLRQRGSKLSGGQKQRTVIARALAKDSPIILADEPTGNLDSATAKEIIKLLYEVSRDKLLIIVTHSFDQVEEYATRQIRIYDGGVEFDHEENADKEKGEQNPDKCGYNTVNDEKSADEPIVKKKKNKFLTRIRNGIALGSAIFKSRPRLSIFMSIIMIIGSIGIFSATSIFSGAWSIFGYMNMFTYYEGRVVVVKQTGGVFSGDELSAWTDGSGDITAESVLRCDYLLDKPMMVMTYEDSEFTYYVNSYFYATYKDDYGKNVIGRYPTADNEALLYLPVYLKPYFGTKPGKKIYLTIGEYPIEVVGLKYYYDNNIEPKILFTKEGFEVNTAIVYSQISEVDLDLNFSVGGEEKTVTVNNLIPYFSEEKKIYLKTLKSIDLGAPGEVNATAPSRFSVIHQSIDSTAVYTFSTDVSAGFLDAATEITEYDREFDYYESDFVYVSTALLKELMEEAIDQTYSQASLFFKNDKEAKEAAGILSKNGFLAVTSDVTTEIAIDTLEVLLEYYLAANIAIIWFLQIIFLSGFIALVTNRSMDAFRGDMAIMRSMGITTGDIRVATYARVFMTVIPALFAFAIFAVIIYAIPFTNGIFTYMYFWQYAIIVLGLIALSIMVTRWQLKRLFRQSVKKTIQSGGNV